jgi:N-carbamoyl-L-amino-acid hydrolase
VRAWLDARAEDQQTLDALLEVLTRQGAERAERDGTTVQVTAESSSPRVDFDPGLRDRLAAVVGTAVHGVSPVRANRPMHADAPAPALATGAGHDAGVLAAAGVRTAMLFVRNPTGVSHAPDEHAAPEDCLAGVAALAGVLADLAGGGREP